MTTRRGGDGAISVAPAATPVAVSSARSHTRFSARRAGQAAATTPSVSVSVSSLCGRGRGAELGQLGSAPARAPQCRPPRAGQQLLLFLNSPFSVICNLVGLVGEMPLRACMLYLSFSCVSALMRRALAASSDAMRFSCG